MESFLTVNEYAEIMRVHPMTVYRRCDRGEIKHKKVGKAIRIYASELAPPVTDDEKNENIRKFVFG